MTNAAKNWTICTLAASLLVVAGLSASLVQAERKERHKLINRLERHERKVAADECRAVVVGKKRAWKSASTISKLGRDK